jgi:peptidoglycan/LPS O-acetylase OafA/YrhL
LRENTTHRFAGLDLLRGIAAVAVLLMHCWTTPSSWPQASPNLLPRAYLAVDLFFVLSGFVIAHAYGQRLGSAAEVRRYCLARLIRLYPFYLAAVVIAAAEMLLAVRAGHGADPNVTSGHLSASFATALLFLPTPQSWSVWPPLLFPLAFTAWTLLWELLVNLLYGFGGPRFRGLWLAAPVLLGGAGLCATLYVFGSADAGGYWQGAWVGGVRALFSFLVGVALFRIRDRFRTPSIPLPILAIALLLAFVPARGGAMYDFACIAFLFPLLVWLGAEASMSARLRDVSLFAGFLSYPVYLLQAPLLWALPPLAVRLSSFVPPGELRQIAVQLYPCAIIAAAWLVARWFDQPVREWLRQRLLDASRHSMPDAPSATTTTSPAWQ